MCEFLNKATIGEFLCGEVAMKAFVVESDVPCFHLCDSLTFGNKFHSCIRLGAPTYISCMNEGSSLSNDEIHELVHFMESEYHGHTSYRKHKIRTMWDYTVVQWNNENPSNEMEITEGDDGYIVTPPMPDYTKLR